MLSWPRFRQQLHCSEPSIRTGTPPKNRKSSFTARKVVACLTYNSASWNSAHPPGTRWSNTRVIMPLRSLKHVHTAIRKSSPWLVYWCSERLVLLEHFRLTWREGGGRRSPTRNSILTQAPVNIIKGKVEYPSLLAILSLKDEIRRVVVIGLDQA